MLRVTIANHNGDFDVLVVRDDQCVTFHLDDGPVVMPARMINSVFIEEEDDD